MANTDIQLKKQQLISKLQILNNESLLQRVSDFLDGILAASQDNQEDWWDDLSQQDKADLIISLEQAESGQEKPMEEVFKKYGL